MSDKIQPPQFISITCFPGFPANPAGWGAVNGRLYALDTQNRIWWQPLVGTEAYPHKRWHLLTDNPLEYLGH